MKPIFKPRLPRCTGIGLTALILLLVLPHLAMGTGLGTAQRTKRYVVIVANNRSMDEGVTPLRYADDDGAKYFELFKAAGADVSLLTVLDADAQKRYPEAAAVALPPKHHQLIETLDGIFSAIAADRAAGQTTDFFFIYAGHGNLGPNQEGYLNLLDHRFRRSELYGEIVSKSPATFNHLILDACHAYFVVNKRGGKPDKEGDYRDEVRDFMKRETLASYPNTGVILAASSESETHEWNRLESGIFSHELLSALMGAGDIDGDGLVTYSEAAACVEAANAAIDLPSARLKVYFQPPAQKTDEPLMNLRAFQGTPTLSLPRRLAGRYYVEDARGVRVLDLHYSHEQALILKLVGTAPFYIRTAGEEAMVASGRAMTDLAALIFSPLSEGHRGPVEQSFRKHLYEIPFGIGFYRGMAATADRQDESPAPSLPSDEGSPGQRRPSALAPIGWAILSTGLATGVASGIMYATARAAYDDYNHADTATKLKSFRESSRTRLNVSRALLGAGAGLAAIGGSLLLADALKKRRSPGASAFNRATPYLAIGEGSAALGVSGDF